MARRVKDGNPEILRRRLIDLLTDFEKYLKQDNRIKVLERDNFRCRCCDWNSSEREAEDPRTLLELHHIEHHAEGGSNKPENLITLCNVHHDDVHREKISNESDFYRWLEENCS